MKKTTIAPLLALLIFLVSIEKIDNIWSQHKVKDIKRRLNNTSNSSDYRFPEFYKGLYLNSFSGKNLERFYFFVKMASRYKLNTLVIDIQDSRYKKCSIPKENVDYCLKNGIHPIARIVVFPDGLRKYPVSEQSIMEKIELAEDACRIGFKEIQFDYIRFNDYRILRRLSLKEKYAFIEGFLKKARNHLKKYRIRVAADIFGRIPLNRSDTIGQRIEGLDKVVDIICPMAYPSHYTWSKKYQSNPYYTVYITSKRARERTRNADIVTYIQAFNMKIGISRLSFEKYIQEQIRAVHDSGIRGYLLWNARQRYEVSFRALHNFYKNYNKVLETESNNDNRNKSTL